MAWILPALNIASAVLPMVGRLMGSGHGYKVFLGGARDHLELAFGGEEFGQNLDALKKRNKLALAKKAEAVVRTITHDPEKATTVGSFTFAKISRYSSDIDIFEQLMVYNATKESATEQIAEWIREVCKRVKKTKGFWFSELKVGYDDRYWDPVDIPKTSGAKLLKNILGLLNKELISADDYEAMKACIGEGPRAKAFKDLKSEEKFVKIYREYFLLRWSESEAIAGVKEVRGRKFHLHDAVGQPGICKLDVVTFVGLRPVECTTFWINKYQDHAGKVHLLNVPGGDDLSEYLGASIRQEVLDLSNDKSLYYNPLKTAKRMWSIAAYAKNLPIINKLIPLLSGDYSGLNQVKNDLGTLRALLRAQGETGRVPLELVAKALDDINVRVSNLADVDLGDSFPRDMNSLIENLDKLGRDEIMGTLKKWVDRMNEEIIKYSDAYMRKEKLIPVPKGFLESKEVEKEPQEALGGVIPADVLLAAKPIDPLRYPGLKERLSVSASGPGAGDIPVTNHSTLLEDHATMTGVRLPAAEKAELRAVWSKVRELKRFHKRYQKAKGEAASELWQQMQKLADESLAKAKELKARIKGRERCVIPYEIDDEVEYSIPSDVYRGEERGSEGGQRRKKKSAKKLKIDW